MLERPQGFSFSNPAHPLAKYLVLHCAAEGENLHDLLIPGRLGAKSGTVFSSQTLPILGNVLKSNGASSSGVKFPDARLTATTMNTSGLVFACVQFASVSTTTCWFGNTSDASGMRFTIAGGTSGNLDTTANGIAVSSSTGLGIVANVPYFIGAFYDSGGTAWIARRLDSGYTTYSTGTAVSPTGGDRILVVSGRITATNGLNGYMAQCGYMSGAPSAALRQAMFALADDPWMLLRQSPTKRFYFADVVSASGSAGTLSSTLGALTLSGAATVPIAATASNTLGSLTLSGAGTVAISGTATATFDPLTLNGVGTVAVTATMSQTLGALTLSGTAAVTNGPSADLSSTLGALTVSSTAEVTGVGVSTVDTHDGFDPYARKRKAKGGKRKKEVEDLLAKLMGLVPEDASEEIEQAVEVAKATVERISAPQVDYTDQIAALQTAQLQLAKLDALLRSYEDEEEDEDLLLMSM